MSDAPLVGPDGGRLFCVPIAPTLAQGCAEVLRTFREHATGALVPPSDFVPSGAFSQEADTLRAMPVGGERDARRELHSLLVDAGSLVWAHAVDHVRALEHDILMAPPPVWSSLTLTRATLEGCAFVAYLYAPGAPLEQRLARAASLRVKEARNQAAAAGLMGDAEQTFARRDIEEAEQLAAAAGAVEQRGNNGSGRVLGYTVDGEYAPLGHNISEEIKAFLPSWATSSYPLCSGAAHGRPWMIGRGRSDDGSWAGEAATLMAAVITVMGSLEGGVGVFGDYFGHDVSAALAAMEQERMSFLTASFSLVYGS